MGAPPITDDTPPVGHVLALDGLRGVAILLVLPWHLLHPEALAGSTLLAPLSLVRDMGWTGVDLFFVLSGFLITSILVRHRESPRYFRSFYARRILRIVPLYYLLLAICVFVIPAIPYFARYEYFWGDEGTSLGYWLFLSNLRYLLPIPEHQFLGVTWSLAIEEQFYIVWPILVWLVRGPWLAAVQAAILVASVGLRHYFLDFTEMSPQFPHLFTLSHLDGLAVGSLLAVGYAERARYGRALDLFARALPLLALLTGGLAWWLAAFGTERFPIYQPAMIRYGYLLNVLLFGALLLHCVIRSGWIARVARLAPLRSVGKYSYAMYLLHWPAFFLVEDGLARWGIGLGSGRMGHVNLFLLASLTTYALAWVSWRIFEGPINAQKRRFAF